VTSKILRLPEPRVVPSVGLITDESERPFSSRADHKKKPKRRLDIKACQNPEKADALGEQIHEKLLLEEETNASIPRDGQTLTAEWAALSNVLQQAASDSLGFCSRKHQDWFADNCIGIH